MALGAESALAWRADLESPVDSIETVVPCKDIDAAMRLFLDTLGFRLDAIFPADSPRVALVSRDGQRFRLEADDGAGGARLRLYSKNADQRRRQLAECGSALACGVDVTLPDDALPIPALQESLVVSRGGANARWAVGRAGMEYRDLIPSRLGGRFIASHIRIPEGGPVPDYVHYHHVRFQMIFCCRGWVRLVYEDQGPPFVMRAGDCVLQPPHIRHQVLECSDAFEVVEIGCPAEHETLVDHELALPTSVRRPDRDFGGQVFQFHHAQKALWTQPRDDGFETRDTGIAAATRGEASALALRPAADFVPTTRAHELEFLFRFVLAGSVTLECAGRDPETLHASDAVVVPSGLEFSMVSPSTDLRLLEVRLPAGEDPN